MCDELLDTITDIVKDCFKNCKNYLWVPTLTNLILSLFQIAMFFTYLPGYIEAQNTEAPINYGYFLIGCMGISGINNFIQAIAYYRELKATENASQNQEEGGKESPKIN